jgi:hypothetical protein
MWLKVSLCVLLGLIDFQTYSLLAPVLFSIFISLLKCSSSPIMYYSFVAFEFGLSYNFYLNAIFLYLHRVIYFDTKPLNTFILDLKYIHICMYMYVYSPDKSNSLHLCIRLYSLFSFVILFHILIIFVKYFITFAMSVTFCSVHVSKYHAVPGTCVQSLCIS